MTGTFSVRRDAAGVVERVRDGRVSDSMALSYPCARVDS